MNSESSSSIAESTAAESTPAAATAVDPIAADSSADSAPEPSIVKLIAKPVLAAPAIAEPGVVPVVAAPAPVAPVVVAPAATAAEPSPVEPAPLEPAPVEPAPVEPAPVEPAPVEPAPVEPVATKATTKAATKAEAKAAKATAKAESDATSAAAAFSMDDFAKALEGFNYEFKKGQVVKGRVCGYESDGALVDIGAKSPAFLPSAEASVQQIKDVSAIVTMDEERSFLIIREQDANGQLTVSLRGLEIKKIWDQLAAMQETAESFQVRVTGINKGGVTVNAKGLRGFIPRSHLVEREDLEALVGTTLTASVLDCIPGAKKLVLSNRLATRSAAFSQLEMGQLIEGKIASLRPFGVFVDLPGGATALLHINQISKNYVESLDQLFQVGQPLKALIANLDAGQGKISLTTKLLENYPGEMIEKTADVQAEAEDRYGRARKLLLGE